MKYVKYVLILLFVFSLTGCNDVDIEVCDHLSNTIIKLHKDINTDTSSLTKEEKDILNEFLESESIDNKIINISDSITFSEESYTTNPNTSGVYQKDGKYYIKYSDVNWINNDGQIIAIIDIDGKEEALKKSLNPLLYYDTYSSDKYVYEYLWKEKIDDDIVYYYKSIKDGSGLEITYHIKNKKIDSISTHYRDYVKEKTRVPSKLKIIATSILAMAVVVFMVFMFVKLIKGNKSY